MSFFAILVRLIYNGESERRIVTTLDAFERDLLDCGVPESEVQLLAIRYARALESGSHIDWIELYVGIFATLRHSTNRTRTAGASSLARMLLLINDDLGSALFSREARDELARASDANFASA
jgi:hypothetical protein